MACSSGSPKTSNATHEGRAAGPQQPGCTSRLVKFLPSASSFLPSHRTDTPLTLRLFRIFRTNHWVEPRSHRDTGFAEAWHSHWEPSDRCFFSNVSLAINLRESKSDLPFDSCVYTYIRGRRLSDFSPACIRCPSSSSLPRLPASSIYVHSTNE